MTRGEADEGDTTDSRADRGRSSLPALSSRRTLAAHIAATRHARTQRALALLTGALSLLVLLAAGGGWLLEGYISSHLSRVNAGTSAAQSGPLNILLAGVDVRAGLTRRQQ